MILQADMAALIGALIIVAIIVAIIVFFIGVFITKWWAGKKGWSTELKPAILLNLFWLIVNICLGWLAYGIVALIINIIVGGIIAAKLYDKETGESIIFCLVVLIIIFIFWIIITLILVAIIVAAIIGTGAY
ncbi:MAG: hypothetical protein ACFFAO_21040 [Candidatus Hermodarchaeota archaeon]